MLSHPHRRKTSAFDTISPADLQDAPQDSLMDGDLFRVDCPLVGSVQAATLMVRTHCLLPFLSPTSASGSSGTAFAVF